MRTFCKGSKGLFLLEMVFCEGKTEKTLHSIYDKNWKEKPGNHEMQNRSGTHPDPPYLITTHTQEEIEASP